MNEPDPKINSERLHEVITLIRSCARAAQLYLARTARREGMLVTELNALTRIAESDGLNPTTIATSLPLDSSSMTELADRLERAGLIKRSRVPTDRRSISLRATPAGKRKITRTYKDLNTALSNTVADMSDQQLDTVIAFMNALQTAVEELAQPDAPART